MSNVILSSPIILESGDFKVTEISITEAIEFSKTAHNYCGHETVKILGLSPSEARKNAKDYNKALALKPKVRLEFGREYTVDEIMKIGVNCIMIEKKKKERFFMAYCHNDCLNCDERHEKIIVKASSKKEAKEKIRNVNTGSEHFFVFSFEIDFSNNEVFYV